ncbi:MAG: site-specific DNA-methyltransferase [Armatimonadota bacterium]|nr:site-specific DNA-methyltransferase [Armatimonadota bacterium]
MSEYSGSRATARPAAAYEFRIGEGKTACLYLQDCVLGMREHLRDSSVSVVVTSPPYNLGVDYSAYDDRISRAEYLEWTDIWAREVKRVLEPDGSFFLNVGSKPTDPLVPFQILEVMCRSFVLQNVIHWVKSIAILKSEVGDYPGIVQDVVVGHYKPINSCRYLNDCHEYIFHFTHRGDVALDRLAVGVPYQDTSNVKRWRRASKGLHCRGNTWFIPYETIQNREKDRPHPAAFPVELPMRCIRLHGLSRVKLVLDPFLGIGTTAVACARLGLSFVGFEIAQDYLEQACRRLTLELAQAKLDL